MAARMLRDDQIASTMPHHSQCVPSGSASTDRAPSHGWYPHGAWKLDSMTHQSSESPSGLPVTESSGAPPLGEVIRWHRPEPAPRRQLDQTVETGVSKSNISSSWGA
jgi:hypothetical protein